MIARIATLSQSKCFARTVQGNRDFILRVLQTLRECRPDLICLPEAFTARGVAVQSCADVAETVPGPTTDIIAEVALRFSCYIACPIYRRCASSEPYPGFRNSTVLLDRKGAIAGVYDKMRPSVSSADYTVLEQGVLPGVTPGCFDLDFGRIGISICMDLNFPHDWEVMARSGVKLVLWPSASEGGLLLRARALEHQYYIVSAVRRGRAQVINPCGHVTAETTPDDTFTLAEINLDFAVARKEFNAGVPNQIQAAYGTRVAVHEYSEDNLFLVEPREPTITAEHLRQEFRFETSREFFLRHAQIYDQLRAHRKPEPQRALHGNRAIN